MCSKDDGQEVESSSALTVLGSSDSETRSKYARKQVQISFEH